MVVALQFQNLRGAGDEGEAVGQASAPGQNFPHVHATRPVGH